MFKKILSWFKRKPVQAPRRGRQPGRVGVKSPLRGRISMRVYRADTDTWEDRGVVCEGLIGPDGHINNEV